MIAEQLLAFLNASFLATILAASIRVATPILLVALGEAVAERAGMLNISAEGMMALGALTAFVAAFLSGDVWVGMGAALLAGAVAGLVFGAVTIERGADHVVTGIVMNILCFGMASLIYQSLFSMSAEVPQIATLRPYRVPWLSDIPILGRALFSQSPIVYVAFGLIPIFWALLHRTKLGLSIRAVGENPKAAETAGINVWWVRHFAIVIGGAMAALGGATLSIAQVGGYLDNMTAGRGFIALAVVVFGGWNPWRIGAASLLFGAAEALQLRLQALGVPIPHELLLAVPYALTIVLIASFASTAAYPSAMNTSFPRRARRYTPPSPTGSE